MIQNKLIRKTTVVILALFVFALMSMSALGAATYTTSTTYDANTSAVSVVSEVTGAEPYEEIAYLAYKGNDPAAANAIVYIDQNEASGTGAKTFSYSTTRDDFVTATVKFGGNLSSSFTPALGGDILPGYRAVNFTVYGGGSVVGVDLTGGVGTLYVPNNANTTINFEADTGYVLENMVVDGVIQQNFIAESYIVSPVEGDTAEAVEIELFFVEVTTEGGTVNAAAEGTEGIVYAGVSTSDPEDNFLQVLASSNVGSGFEYGIAYATKPDFSDYVLYRAFGRGSSGAYIVRLEGSNEVILSSNTYYARAYIKNIDTEEITFGEDLIVIEFN